MHRFRITHSNRFGEPVRTEYAVGPSSARRVLAEMVADLAWVNNGDTFVVNEVDDEEIELDGDGWAL